MIAIASDHAGYFLKEELINHLKEKGLSVIDFGPTTDASVDYPDYAQKVSNSIISGQCNLGILICGTGIGMSIAANKVNGIRAALCTNGLHAKLTRQHNNANVLALGARITGRDLAFNIVDEFVSTEFLGGRHERRVTKINVIEKAQNKEK